MSESKFSIADGYVDFVELFNREDLEQALISYKGTDQYDAVFRYYFGCFNVPDSSRLLEPLGLLKHCLLYTSPSPRDLSTSRMPSSA